PELHGVARARTHAQRGGRLRVVGIAGQAQRQGEVEDQRGGAHRGDGQERDGARAVAPAPGRRGGALHYDCPSLIFRSLFSRSNRQSATSGYCVNPVDHSGCIAQRGSKQWWRSQRWPTWCAARLASPTSSGSSPLPPSPWLATTARPPPNCGKPVIGPLPIGPSGAASGALVR